MRRFFTELLGDGRGGADEQALISMCGAGVFFGLQIYSVVAKGQLFDPLAFGTGFGALLGATSAGFGLRSKLTPGRSGEGGIDPVTGRFVGGIHAGSAV
jgi:hypothetical protein